MKKIILAALVISTAFFFSCKNSGGGDPKAVLVEFFDALSKKDLAAARKLATTDSKSMLDLMEMGMKSTGDKGFEKYDKSKMEFGAVKIDGDKATVTVKETTSGESVNYPLKKEDGSWKVAFDKSSLMTIGMDKMNEKGVNPMEAMDSLNNGMQKGMDELNKVDMDSLKRSMDEGMKSLDSLQKEMKKVQ